MYRNKDVFYSINALRKVFAESENAHLFAVIPKDFNEEVINVAKSDRDKMIEIMNQFYKDHGQNSEGIDDFIILFDGKFKMSELERISDEILILKIANFNVTFEELELKRIDNKYLFARSYFLQIPRILKWKNRNIYHFMERIAVQHEKDTMIREFMHTYSNMKADDLYNIAQLLLKRENIEDKETGRKLL